MLMWPSLKKKKCINKDTFSDDRIYFSEFLSLKYFKFSRYFIISYVNLSIFHFD